MPLDNKNENEIIHYLKAISMFDPETDFEREETRRQLSITFRKLIMSDDAKAKEFITRFLKGVDKVIKDMGVVDSSATDDVSDEVGAGDEVDMSPTPPAGGDEPVDPALSPSAPPPLPDDQQMADSYNYLLDRANSYIYM